MTRWTCLATLAFGLLAGTEAFVVPQSQSTFVTRPFIKQIQAKSAVGRGLHVLAAVAPTSKNESEDDKKTLVQRVWARLDTLESAGLKDQTNLQGGFTIKQTLVFFGVAFLWKWYRARYINKIPVWDRQPQWNVVVTNREQEKELKAYTCNTCGSTLFIARQRNWFFEGDTGLKGLGCFTCGAKGADNFVMNRDEIVEDLGDEDDYFDYERPLDFVSAAERRALIKEAGGDEDKANQGLVEKDGPPEDEQQEQQGESESETVAESEKEEKAEQPVVDAEIVADAEESPVVEKDPVVVEAPVEKKEPPPAAPAPVPAPVEKKEPPATAPTPVPAPVEKKEPTASDEDFDALDMDAF